MKLKIHGHNFEVPESLTQLVDKKARKIAKILPTFASDDLDLHVTLEKLSRTRQFHAVLVLTLPQNSIRVEDLEPTASASLLGAFDELLRRVKKFKSQLNREKFWQRQISPLPAAETAEDGGETVRLISQSLDMVDNYIRRELYHQSLVESLPPGLVETQAVLDDVFLEARSHISRRPETCSVEQWLIRIAREKIQQRIRDLEATRSDRHVGEAAVLVERWHDEVLNFYQPDEALQVEDLLPDEHSLTPEELLSRHESEEQLHRAIAQLPAGVRESFVLFALEGFNSDEIAMITRKLPVRVLEEVQEAQQWLRRQVALR